MCGEADVDLHSEPKERAEMLGEGGALYEPKKSSSMRRFRIYYLPDINLPTSKWLCWKAHRLARKSIIKELQLKEEKLREQKQQTQITSKRELSQKDAI